MKKLFVLIAVVIVLQVMPLFGQTVPEDMKSEYFYYNVPIEKVYPYRRGYVVVYRKAGSGLARTYLPREWFNDAAGKGELIYLSSGPSWPYLSVYYKEGEFTHVRLYVRWNRSHASWGNIPLGVNLEEQFDNVDEANFRLEF